MFVPAAAVFVLVIGLLLPRAAAAGDSYGLHWSTIDGGGAHAAAAENYAIGGTIGQADAARLDNGQFAIDGGFWPGIHGGGPVVGFAAAAALPGGMACIAATLTTVGTEVASTSNDLGFDSDLTLTSCTIAPAIGAESSANKQLTASPLVQGARVQVGGNSHLIPGGLLYTCRLSVAAEASPGNRSLSNATSATDSAGAPVAGMAGGAGLVIVTNCRGDCSGNGTVTLGEVQRCTNHFLGAPLCDAVNPSLSCPVADDNHNGSVSLDEVQQCVNRFLGGC